MPFHSSFVAISKIENGPLRRGQINELNAKGYKTKVQVRASGPHRGGCEFRRGTLYHLLSNPIYRGQIVHKGEAFAGEHEAIVSEDLWQAVQDKLKAHALGSSRRLKGQQPSMLAGLLFDGEGRAMTPSHASKGKAQRYRYYVTRPDQVLGNPAFRVSAHDLEQIVTEKLAGFFASPSNIAALASPEIEAHALRQALGKADLIAATLRSGTAKSRHEIVSTVLAKATLFEDRVELALSPDGLAGALECSIGAGRASLTLSVPASRLRRGHQIRLVIEGEGAVAKPEPLIRPKHVSKLAILLAQAYQARQLLLDSPDTPLTDLARQHGKCRKHLTKLIELSCLAPDIVEAIMKDQQPRWLTAAKLRAMDLPVSWAEQREQLLVSPL